jgi:serine/threonine protein kinase
MHKNEYAHLDIKPANIVIDTTTKESKLIDFGLIFKTTEIIRKVVGTPSYMSPEIILRKATSVEKCDIYSLGITFIECAFAFEYRNRDIKSIVEHDLFNVMTRYIPPQIDSQLPLNSLTLTQVIVIDGFVRLNIPSKLPDDIHTRIIYKNNEIVYTFENLYKDMLNIHTKYPIFRRMIAINPDDRCSIIEIINECYQQLTSLTLTVF